VACGFLHLDKLHRDSLMYDLMERERVIVDGVVLDPVGGIKLTAGDLVWVSDGSCGLHMQLARAVVARCRTPQQRIEDHAKCLASLFRSSE
jgi:CRISPR/Cas system-associated endonuclease Cas1